MKIFVVALTLIVLTSCQGKGKLETKCDCEGLVDWQRNVEVELFDRPDGQIINTLTHDLENENFLTFTIVASKDRFFKVKIGRAHQGQQQSGWIKKENYLGIYARNYSDDDTLFLYTMANKQSQPSDTIVKYLTDIYGINDCEGKWAKVSLTKNEVDFVGWIEPEMQCSSPYTTCN